QRSPVKKRYQTASRAAVTSPVKSDQKNCQPRSLSPACRAATATPAAIRMVIGIHQRIRRRGTVHPAGGVASGAVVISSVTGRLLNIGLPSGGKGRVAATPDELEHSRFPRRQRRRKRRKYPQRNGKRHSRQGRHVRRCARPRTVILLTRPGLTLPPP